MFSLGELTSINSVIIRNVVPDLRIIHKNLKEKIYPLWLDYLANQAGNHLIILIIGIYSQEEQGVFFLVYMLLNSFVAIYNKTFGLKFVTERDELVIPYMKKFLFKQLLHLIVIFCLLFFAFTHVLSIFLILEEWPNLDYTILLFFPLAIFQPSVSAAVQVYLIAEKQSLLLNVNILATAMKFTTLLILLHLNFSVTEAATMAMTSFYITHLWFLVRL